LFVGNLLSASEKAAADLGGACPELQWNRARSERAFAAGEGPQQLGTIETRREMKTRTMLAAEGGKMFFGQSHVHLPMSC